MDNKIFLIVTIGLSIAGGLAMILAGIMVCHIWGIFYVSPTTVRNFVIVPVVITLAFIVLPGLLYNLWSSFRE